MPAVTECIGGTMLQPDAPVRFREKRAELGVCFTNMGTDATISEAKGLGVFSRVVKKCAQRQDALGDVTFYCLGTGAPVKGAQNVGLLSQAELTEFYRQHADVYLNLDTGAKINGWPLGTEALLTGAVLISTDPNGMNGGYGYTEEEMFIVEARDVNSVVERILELAEDRDMWKRMSDASLRKSLFFFGFENQQAKVFAAIESSCAKGAAR